MSAAERPPAIEAARDFVARNYPWAIAAFLGGSASRGEMTETSDLDIVVVGAVRRSKQSLAHLGWPVELFTHTPQTLEDAFDAERGSRRAAITAIVATGIVLTSVDGAAERLAAGAAERLRRGPAPMSPEELAFRRFRITDAVDDLRGGLAPADAVFLAGLLLQDGANLVLAAGGRWEGLGKQAGRLLRAADPERADRAVVAMRSLMEGNPEPLIAWAEDALSLAGGRLREGYAVEAPGL